VKKNTIFSEYNPKITIEVNQKLEFIGKLNFELFESAAVERVLFAETKNDSIKRLIAFQFEEYLPHTKYVYKKRYKDSIRLGNYWFGKENIDVVNKLHVGNFIKKWKGRGLEIEVTYNYLKNKGYIYEDVVLSDYLVYISPDLRYELVIAYYENISNFDLTLKDLQLNNDFTRGIIPIDIDKPFKNKRKVKDLKINMLHSFKVLKD